MPVSEMNRDSGKYVIHIDKVDALAIGGNSTITPPGPSLNLGDLRQAIYRAGALLRDIPAEIGGQHLNRPGVGQILDWLHAAPADQRLGLLLDQPGSGKSIILRDVLHRLEAEHQTVLAIKADLLPGINSRADLADRLGLPCRLRAASRPWLP